MDKLNIIKNSIEQIRTAIGEPCDHIENLPEKINELVEDASKVGYSTVFVFSNKENPNKPTGSLYENGIVSDLDDNWSQTKIEDSGKVWMSFSLFKQSGGQVSDWVYPILITRSGKDGKDGKDAFTPQFKIENGFWYIQYSENGEWVKVGQATGSPGKDGVDGKDGLQGPQGEPGKDGQDGAPGQDGPQGPAGADGKDGADGEPGRGIVSVEKLFAVNNDPHNNPTEGWTTIENVSTSPTNRYMWCKETTTFTSGDSTVIHYIVAIEGKPGANGTGNDAPIIYPAGVWDSEKEYIAESDKVPYVFYTADGKYYMLNSKYLIVGEGEGSTWKGVGYAPGKTYEDEPIWLPIDSFEAIYSDIGLFNQALVGKWVFHGDYMFSQDGIDASGNSKKYSDFTDPKAAIGNGEFIPNICFNAVTGEGWFAGKKIQFNVDGSGSLGNGISWDNTGDITIDGVVLNPVSKTPSDALNKTVYISSGLTSARAMGFGSYDSTKVSSENPIRKVGTVTVMSTNENSPSDIRLSNGTLSIPNVIGEKTGVVNSLTKDFNRFVLAPNAIVTFDVYDNYSKSTRVLVPQTTFGWFKHNNDVVPYSCSNNVSYEDLSSITTYPNSVDTSLDVIKILDLPGQVVKYMSIKLSKDLHATLGSNIFFGKYANEGVRISDYSSSILTTETYIKPSETVQFREGGSFGFGATSSVENVTSPNITFKFYNDISMIGQITYTL